MFRNNYASLQGGAIYATGFSYLELSDSTSLINNNAHDIGDDIFASNTEKILKIEGLTITNYRTKTSCYVEMATLQVISVNFFGFTRGGSTKGSAIQCHSCRGIYVYKSTFRNLKSLQGGSIYIYESQNNRKTGDAYGKYQIVDSEFSRSTAVAGGAVFIDNAQHMTFNNVRFYYNKAYNSTEDSLKNV